jgi:hypothetical protein
LHSRQNKKKEGRKEGREIDLWAESPVDEAPTLFRKTWLSNKWQNQSVEKWFQLFGSIIIAPNVFFKYPKELFKKTR